MAEIVETEIHDARFLTCIRERSFHVIDVKDGIAIIESVKSSKRLSEGRVHWHRPVMPRLGPLD